MVKALKFNPGFQTDREAIANFVVRQHQFDAIIGALTATTAVPIPVAKIMVVAPRGAGKTTLCRRVAAEVRIHKSLAEGWHPVFLGEESYTVTSPGEFFLECLFQLRDQTPEAALTEVFDHVAASSSEEELLRNSISALRAFSQNVGKRLLIIVENFHIILQDQIGRDAEVLIDCLNDVSLFGVLATSVSQGDVTEEIELPENYLVISLPSLTLEECYTLWVALTEQDVKLERIRPLQILTGGSPRLLHILAEFMRTPSLRDLTDNLNLLIDQNTEYFKSQLDALPSVERKVFAALLDAWDPRSAKQVAEAARVGTNVASSMLARLSERGAVIKEMGKGRGAIYYTAERLFNIYYLMRRRSHPSSRVKALVSFMTQYYDRDELISTTAKLIDEACAVEPSDRGDYYSWYNALLSHAPESVRKKIIDETPEAFFVTSKDENILARSGKIIIAGMKSQKKKKDAKTEIGKIASELDDLLAASEYEKAYEVVTSALIEHNKSSTLWLKLAIVELSRGRAKEVLEATTRAIEINSKSAVGFALRGYSQRMLGDDAKAEADLRASMDIEPTLTIALAELAEIVDDKGEVNEALELYRRAYLAGPMPDQTIAKFSLALIRAGETEEAEHILREAVKDHENFAARRELVDYLDETGRQEEGIELLYAAATALENWRGWADVGAFLIARTERHIDAEAALTRAVELGADSPGTFARLAHVKEHLNTPAEEIGGVATALVERLPDNPRAWITAAGIFNSAKDLPKTQNAFNRAIALDETAYSRVLYASYLSGTEGRKAEAVQVLRDALSDSTIKKTCNLYRALADLLVHNGDDKAARFVVEEAIGKYPTCVCCRVLCGEISARAAKPIEAQGFFEDALEIDNTCVPALTGMARLVQQNKAEELIARAIEADPDDPRCLLARASIRINLDERIADAEAALELDGDLIEAHLLVAEAKAALHEDDDAIVHLKTAIGLLENEMEYIPNFVSSAMRIAKLGLVEKIGQIIEDDAFGPSLEPLSVALRLLQGKNPVVAKEVLEVAQDIVARALTEN